jgi:hypothetical protein
VEELRVEVTRSREEVEHRLLLESDGPADKVPRRSKPYNTDFRRGVTVTPI